MLSSTGCWYGSIQHSSSSTAFFHRFLKISNSMYDCLLTCTKHVHTLFKITSRLECKISRRQQRNLWKRVVAFDSDFRTYWHACLSNYPSLLPWSTFHSPKISRVVDTLNSVSPCKSKSLLIGMDITCSRFFH